MQIREEKQGDVLIVAIDDHLDTAAAPALESKLEELIGSGNHRILMDCADLLYVTSAGLKVFLVTAKKLEPLGGQLVISGLQSSVLMIFEMIGFTRIMKVVPTREEALQVLASPVPAS
jgi:anti-anti-sigma factor